MLYIGHIGSRHARVRQFRKDTQQIRIPKSYKTVTFVDFGTFKLHNTAVNGRN